MVEIVQLSGFGKVTVAIALGLAALVAVARTQRRGAIALRTTLGALAIVGAAAAPRLVAGAGQVPPPPASEATPVKPAEMPAKKDVPKEPPPRGETLTFDVQSVPIQPLGSQMWAAAHSPDGTTLVTTHGATQSQGEIRVWDRKTAKVKQTLTYDKGVRSACYSPDGKVFVSACFDGAVRFHDPATFAVWAVGDESSGGHNKSGVNCVRFFKKGTCIATSGFDGTVRIWDVPAIMAARKTGDAVKVKPVAVLEGHQGLVLSVSGSDDGKTLLSGGMDKTARLWELPASLPKMGEKPLEIKKEKRQLQGHNTVVEAIAVSPDGKHLVSGAWGGVVVMRLLDGTNEFRTQFPGGCMCAVFSRDGKYLAVGSGVNPNPTAHEVRVWDVAEKKEIARREDFGEGVKGLEFTADGKTLFVAVADQKAHVWPWAEPKDQQTFSPATPGFNSMPFIAGTVSPDGHLLVFSGESQSVFVFDRKKGKLVTELTGHADVVPALAFAPDGKTLATAGYDKTIKLWNTETWKEKKTLKGHTGWVFDVAFSPDGKTLASGSYDKTVRLWDVESGVEKAHFDEHKGGVRSVAFSPDGKKLVSGGSDRVPRVWDLADGKLLLALKGHKKAVRAVAFAPDGKSIASGSEDQTVKLWDAQTGKEKFTFPSLPDLVTSLAFSPKGQTLAAGSFDGALVLLDPLSGRTRQTLRAHNEGISALVFAESGQHLISIGQDKTLLQWSLSKTELASPAKTLVSAIGFPVAIAASPNGTAVALASLDGAIALVNVKSGTMKPCLIHREGITQLAVSNDLRIASIGKENTLEVSDFKGHAKWTGKAAYVAFTPDGQYVATAEGKDVVFRDAATGAIVKRFAGGHEGDIVRIEISLDGTLMLSAGKETKVRLWDVATCDKLQETSEFGNYSTITLLSFSPDSKKFAVAAYGPDQPPPDDMSGMFRPVKSVRVYTVPKPEAKYGNNIDFSPQPPDQPIVGLHWDRAGQTLMMPASDGTVRYNDFPQTGVKEAQRFRAHDGAVIASALTVDGLVTVGEDLAVRLWKLPQSPAPTRAARIFGAFGGAPVLAGEFDPSGRYLFAIDAWDKKLQVFLHPPGPAAVEFDPGYGGVNAVAYSANGKFLATGHDNGEVNIWDPASGHRIARLTGLETVVRGVVFTPDGNSLIAMSQGTENGDKPGEIVVFDIASQKIRQRMEDSAGRHWQIALSPDGGTLAAGSADGLVRLWEVSTGKLQRTLDGHAKGVRAVVYSPDGTVLASGGFDGVIRLWNPATGEQRREVVLPNASVNGLAFTPDGKDLVAIALGGTVYDLRVSDPTSQPRAFDKGHVGHGLTVAVLKDGKTVVTGGGKLGAPAPKAVAPAPKKAGGPAPKKDGPAAKVDEPAPKVEEPGEIKVWDLATGKLLGEFRGITSVVEALAVAPDGLTVTSGGWASGKPGELRQWTVTGFRAVATIPATTTGPYVSAAAASPDGKLLAIGTGHGAVATFDLSDPSKPTKINSVAGQHDHIYSIAFDAAGKRLVTCDEKGKVIVWDADQLVPLKEWKASSTLMIYRAKFTPDGKSVVTGAGLWKDPKVAGELRVWNAETGAELTKFPPQSAGVWDFAFLDGGKTLVTTHAVNGGMGEAPVKVWDFESRTAKRSISIPGDMRCLAVSPDERYVAVGNHGGEIKVIGTKTWQVVATPPSHGKTVFRLGFDATSTLLSSIGEDGTLGITRMAE